MDGDEAGQSEIVQLMQVAEPNQKPSLVDALIQTYPDNPIMSKLYAQLHSIPPRRRWKWRWQTAEHEAED